jgi:hypothetical protein
LALFDFDPPSGSFGDLFRVGEWPNETDFLMNPQQSLVADSLSGIF